MLAFVLILDPKLTSRVRPKVSKYQAVSEVSKASYTLGNMPSSTGFPVALSRSLPHSAGKKEPSPTLCLSGPLKLFSR